MDKYKIPLVEGLTLSRIGDLLCNKYNRKRGELGDFIYRDERTFRRKANGQAQIYQKDVDNLVETLTNSICNGDEEEFYIMIKEWFPALQHFQSNRDILKVFKANLIGIVPDKGQSIILNSNNNYISTIQFFQSCLEYSSPIKSIKLSAQTGWSWFDDIEKRNLLKELAHKGIEIMVIGNPMTPVMKNIILAMRDSQKELDYKGVNSTLDEWHKYETAFDNVKLRVSVDYPILHQSYIVDFTDGSAKALIRDYAYGSPVEKLAPRKVLMNDTSEYEYYKTEFLFLWSEGLKYDNWKKTLPKQQEILSAGNYILMYLSQQRENSGEQKWVYCSLVISDSNKTSMNKNIPDINIYPNLESNWEYSYEGTVEVTGKMIFLSFHGKEQEEIINISIPRPVREVGRYIGIMTSLTDSGNAPIAFKCACIERSVLSKIDYVRLHSLLSNTNQIYSDTSMVLEPQDMDLFYSTRILSKQTQ